MNRQRIILISIAILGMITTFFPWSTVTPGPKERWITFSLFFTVIAICMGGNHKEFLKGKFIVGIICCASLATLIAATEVLKLLNVYGIWTMTGPWGATAAGVILIATALIVKENNQRT